jgi:hypothetical protein
VDVPPESVPDCPNAISAVSITVEIATSHAIQKLFMQFTGLSAWALVCSFGLGNLRFENLPIQFASDGQKPFNSWHNH